MLYVYAITERPFASRQPGLQGAAVRSVEADGLAAIVSEHGALERPLSEHDLWAHEGVVEVLMEQMGVLPMRAGTTVPDEDGLRELLRARSDEFRRSLQRVSGAVELGVRAVMPAPRREEGADAPAGSGSAYLLAKLDAKAAVDRSSSLIHDSLRRLARDHATLSTPATGPQMRSAYLVDRDAVEGFLARVESLGAEVPDASIVCTGPWPPYSFVGAAER